MSLKSLGFQFALLMAVIFGGTGCKTICDSFTFDERILVKVPIREPVDRPVVSGSWHFKPLVLASATNREQPQVACRGF